MENWMADKAPTERNLGAEIDALCLKLRVVEGEALLASSLLTRLLSGLVGIGLLTSETVDTFVDETMLVMERHDEALRCAGLSTEQARARLQSLLLHVGKQS